MEDVTAEQLVAAFYFVFDDKNQELTTMDTEPMKIVLKEGATPLPRGRALAHPLPPDA